jgi:hypothetical protein
MAGTSSIFVFVLSLGIFWGILHFDVLTDIQAHAEMAHRIAEEGKAPPHFLYFLLLYFVAIPGISYETLLYASGLVLSISVTIKYAMTRVYLREALDAEVHLVPAYSLTAVALSLIFAFSYPLPGNGNYLGQIPPNVWHNSTTIFVMPLSLALFWLSFRQLKRFRATSLTWMAVLCIASVFAKPSYVFVFVAVWPLAALLRYGISMELILGLIPVAVGTTAVGVLYWMTYQQASTLASGSVIISPFEVWNHWTYSPFLSLTLSLIFPIAVLGLYWKECWRSLLMKYSTSTYLAGLFFFVFFAETGGRKYHANFLWQSIICSYLLFMSCAVIMLKNQYRSDVPRWRKSLCAFALAGHVLSGVSYIFALFYFDGIDWRF